jgi:hypothetical protein
MNTQKTVSESGALWTETASKEMEVNPNVYNPQATIAALQAKLKAADEMARIIDEMFVGQPIWPNHKAQRLVQAREKYCKTWTYLSMV